jgi:hypothetical protein
MADRAMRSKELTTVSHGLVSHTSLKKAGRLRNAASRSFKVKGSVRTFLGGRVFKRIPVLFGIIGKTKEFMQELCLIEVL